tara:strand:+ start:616 stop:807 length:192 start_codon:yes stop_codon:yes gene_type:complete
MFSTLNFIFSSKYADFTNGKYTKYAIEDESKYLIGLGEIDINLRIKSLNFHIALNQIGLFSKL